MTLFKCFDYDGNGEIDFNEFIRVIVGPLNKFRTQIVIKAFKLIDINEDGTLDINDIKGTYNAKMHPEVKSGKRSEDEVLKEFLETFEQHHNTIHGTKADGKITPDEFLEYYAHVSANIDSDAYFELMMSNAWGLASSSNPAQMAYAGSRAKVTNVSSRDAYRNDHHRNLFGTDKATPFEKKKNTEWKTSNAGSYAYNGDGSSMPCAGGGNTGDASKMAFMTSSQRDTGVDYRGI